MSKYYTLAEARADGVDGGLDDAALQKDIDYVEAVFESVTNRQFNTRTLPLKFDGDNSTMLYFREYPIISITSLVIDDELIDPSFYAVYLDKIEIIQENNRNIFRGSSTYAFTYGTQNIEVEGSFGYAANSDALKMVKRAIELMTSATTSGSSSESKMESEKIGDYAYKTPLVNADQIEAIYGTEVDLIVKQLRRRLSISVI